MLVSANKKIVSKNHILPNLIQREKPAIINA